MDSAIHGPVETEAAHCADLARRCQDACLEAAMQWGVRTPGVRSEPSHIGLLLDCAGACSLAADCLRRGSDYANYPCGICAYLCEQCARDCEQLGGNLGVVAVVGRLRECAEACLRLSKSPVWRNAHDG